MVVCLLCVLAAPLAGCGSDSSESEPQGGAAFDAEMLKDVVQPDPIVVERYELSDPGFSKPSRKATFRLAVDAFAAEAGVLWQWKDCLE